jgi:DNA helicase-2/ATP-dependent DNA helicase PcrA
MKLLSEFMSEVSLITDADKEDKNDADYVLLMTIHAAKGLEFPYVYVVGLEENLFPSIQSLNTREDLEEERRLFYVAVTRSELKLTLSYAESRFRWGNLTMCEPSRFIDEIDPHFIDKPRRAPFSGPSFLQSSSEMSDTKASKMKPLHPTASQTDATNANESFEASDTTALQTGMTVAHQKFGTGKVISVEGKGADKKATVFFNGFGQKQLLLKFARLQILE